MLPLISNAFPWDKQKIYSCNAYDDSLSCNQKCVPTSQDVEYKINDKNRLMKVIVYESGKTISTQTFEDCKFVDDKNWSCSKIMLNDGIKVDQQMTNGIVSIREFSPMSMKNIYKCSK